MVGRTGSKRFFSLASNLCSEVEVADTVEREEYTRADGADLHCAVQVEQDGLEAADKCSGVAKKRGSKREGASAKTKHER